MIAGLLVGLLLGGCGMRGRDESRPPGGAIVVRFAHTQLEGEVREAFTEAAKGYMALHPGVVIEQLAIPERIYRQWFTTQLVGDTAPDLLELPGDVELEMLARFFTPLSAAVEEPNPYEGADGASPASWRNAFSDGLAAPPAYVPSLQDVYGIPNTRVVTRLYCNLALFAEIFGKDTPLPVTVGDWQELALRLRDLRPEVSLAAVTRLSARDLLRPVGQALTQRLMIELNHTRHLDADRRELYSHWTSGRWSLAHPAFDAVFAHWQHLAEGFQPGFVQAQRDDALHLFVHRHAIFLPATNRDFFSVKASAGFPIAVVRLPVPDFESPEVAPWALGPVAEMASPVSAVFGLTRMSRHPEVAIDFLRYLTSSGVHAELVRRCRWLPVVNGVAPDPALVPFLPLERGYPPGINLWIGAETGRVLDTNLHELVGRGSREGRFAQAIVPAYGPAFARDHERFVAERWRNVMQQDAVIGGAFLDMLADPEAPAARQRLSELLDTFHGVEALSRYSSPEPPR
jgi:raffinose/stachyose/melibiose transport system substrate-binding protein